MPKFLKIELLQNKTVKLQYKYIGLQVLDCYKLNVCCRIFRTLFSFIISIFDISFRIEKKLVFFCFWKYIAHIIVDVVTDGIKSILKIYTAKYKQVQKIKIYIHEFEITVHNYFWGYQNKTELKIFNSN